MPPPEPVVLFSAASVGYPDGDFRLAIDRFDLAPGECAALVGPSGSGKSTILRAIAGLLKVDGELTVLGERMSSKSDAERRRFRRERLGISLQPFALLEALTVEENVLLPTFAGAPVEDRRALRESVQSLLEQFGIARYAKRKPAKLSHGERQRAAICRAIALSRPLTLLDEPTASLDVAWKRKAVERVVERIRSHDGALLVVTHDREILDSFDRVIEIGDCAHVATSEPAEAT